MACGAKWHIIRILPLVTAAFGRYFCQRHGQFVAQQLPYHSSLLPTKGFCFWGEVTKTAVSLF